MLLSFCDQRTGVDTGMMKKWMDWWFDDMCSVKKEMYLEYLLSCTRTRYLYWVQVPGTGSLYFYPVHVLVPCTCTRYMDPVLVPGRSTGNCTQYDCSQYNRSVLQWSTRYLYPILLYPVRSTKTKCTLLLYTNQSIVTGIAYTNPSTSLSTQMFY